MNAKKPPEVIVKPGKRGAKTEADGTKKKSPKKKKCKSKARFAEVDGPEDSIRGAVEGGRLTRLAAKVELCEQMDGYVACLEEYGVRQEIPGLDAGDFTVRLTFQLKWSGSESGASVYFSSGNNVGIHSIFYEGGSWGKQTTSNQVLPVGKFHKLELRRESILFTMQLNDQDAFAPIQMPDFVSHVQIRPWSNELAVTEFFFVPYVAKKKVMKAMLSEGFGDSIQVSGADDAVGVDDMSDLSLAHEHDDEDEDEDEEEHNSEADDDDDEILPPASSGGAVERGLLTNLAECRRLCVQVESHVICSGERGVLQERLVMEGDFRVRLVYMLRAPRAPVSCPATGRPSLEFSSGQRFCLEDMTYDETGDDLAAYPAACGRDLDHKSAGKGPAAGKWHTLQLTRRHAVLFATIDGAEIMAPARLSDEVSHVQLRPERHEVYLKEFAMLAGAPGSKRTCCAVL